MPGKTIPFVLTTGRSETRLSLTIDSSGREKKIDVFVNNSGQGVAGCAGGKPGSGAGFPMSLPTVTYTEPGPKTE